MPVQPGDHVVFPSSAGVWVEIDEERLLVCRVGEILGVLESLERGRPTPSRSGGARLTIAAWTRSAARHSRRRPAGTPARSSGASSSAGWRAATSTRRRRASPEENFSIAIPPPNVTGALHMGHALNGVDPGRADPDATGCAGRNTLWILGTDHAGIATQAVVEKELRDGGHLAPRARPRGVRRAGLGVEGASTARTIVEQYKRLGASCDYERERFTLDEGYVRAVYRVFVALYDKGYIYRDNYMVNWDPGSHSAISDLEVENREVTDTLYEIDYPVEGSRRGADRRHGAPGDDARRHRRRGEPGRRALRATWSASTRSCRWSAGGCRSSPTSTSTPSSAPAR